MIYVPTRPDEKDFLLQWAEQRLGMAEVDRYDRRTALPVAVVRGGGIAAVCVYSQHRGGNVEMTIASTSPRWATRETVSQLLSWPFTGLGVRRITAMVAISNVRSRRLVVGLGFVQEGRLVDWFADGVDGIVYGFTKRHWLSSRWAGSDMIRKAA